MPRFYIPAQQIQNNLVPLSEQDSQHATRVLRLTQGDEVTACDGANGQYRARIYSQDKKQVLLELLDYAPMQVEPKTRITLYQAMPKGDKPEQILQKCTEVGVSAFCFFYTERCVVKNTKDKSARYAVIAQEAAKQCGRGILPVVQPALSFEGLLPRIAAHQLALVGWEQEEQRTLKQVLSAQDPAYTDIALVIGSEGGFCESEIARLVEQGAHPITLGKRILRTETAGVVLSALVLYERGDMQ